jgi:hypothetical protein
MPTLQRIPLTRHTRRRTARDTKARIDRLQAVAREGTLAQSGIKPAFHAVVYDDRAIMVNDRIEVERSWRGPYMWQVVAYREQP